MGLFDGQVALVTGATSGIGRALARHLAGQGARVIGAGRDQERLAQLAPEVDLALTLDVTRDPSVEVAAQVVQDRYGRLDVLVNNAGIGVFKPWDETTLDDHRRLHEVNVLGPVRLTRALLPHMVEAGQGAVVNVASVAGLRGYPRLGAYTASKFALVGWSETLRAELAGTGVDVVVACPPAVGTPFFENAGYPEYLDQRGPWPLMSAEACAARIARAIARRERRALIGPRAKVVYALSTLAPGAFEAFKAKVRGLPGR
ncbi:MAG: SDR family oxidoreductase [Alphaproteobacteria bacterium]|nr:SDR family oxidoreductase [Alphaproteobacteria bacterium]